MKALARVTVLLVVASAVALAGGAPAPRAPAGSIAEAWKNLPVSGTGCAEGDLTFDYGVEGGMRNLYCRALQVMPWATFVSLAPVSPFVSGPHGPGGLALNDQQRFGHYDPKFVRWAVDALIPAAKNAKLKAETQPIYDAQLRTLARTWFEVRRALAADPVWVSVESRRYQGAIEAQAASWDSPIIDLYHDTLGDSASNWGDHEPNLVRSATMWWLRRSLDGTDALWSEGLEKLLRTYDARWLGNLARRKVPALPTRK
jgi:hypothetical protein